MEKGTGLPPRVNLPSTITTIEGPIVLELVHMVEVGVSAFTLERVRLDREVEMLSRFSEAARSGTPPSTFDIAKWEASLPLYPKNSLKLYLTDGEIELEAMELKPLPFNLGCSSIGTKVNFFQTRVWCVVLNF